MLKTNFKITGINFVLCCGLLALALSVACTSKESGSSEKTVKQNFKEFYLTAAEAYQQAAQANDNINKIQKVNPDGYRTLAYTWNNEALKACTIKVLNDENEEILSDYDKFVQQEKSNFHINEIDESIKPCVTRFYKKNWSQITSMLLFNINPAG